jgi:hypothetical protein
MLNFKFINKRTGKTVTGQISGGSIVKADGPLTDFEEEFLAFHEGEGTNDFSVDELSVEFTPYDDGRELYKGDAKEIIFDLAQAFQALPDEKRLPKLP